MKNFFSCAPYAWSYDRTRKPLKKINKTNCNYNYLKFNPGKTSYILVCGIINHYFPGAGQKVAGECRHGEECLAGSVNGPVLNIVEATKEAIAFDEARQSGSGILGESLAWMAFVLFRTFTLHIWIFAFALCEALVKQPDSRDQNSMSYYINITTHFPPLIFSEFNAKRAILPRKKIIA
ncbi:MAG: hypothetical protein KAR19_19010 [Bacteroidales bacterium]|nr:hypothetical protein [Bacteroidales bacterium]